MKRTIIVVLIVALVAGLAIYSYTRLVRLFEQVTPDRDRKEVEEVAEVDYPVDDTNPEHLAEVLGSQELYEELRDSKVRKPNSSMCIGYAAEGDWRFARSVPWVRMVIKGEIVDIEGETITVALEGDKISMDLAKFVSFYSDQSVQIGFNRYRDIELEFEDIHVGDKVLNAQIWIRAEDNIRVRALMVKR